MRLGWFRPRRVTHVSEWLDDTAALVDVLGAEHEIELFDEERAHDFIRQDFRAPFDLCVYELANTRQHAYVWPYLLHVPGVLRLRSLSLHESRTESLERQRRERDRALELAFGGWDLVSTPLLASRVTVVSDAHAAAHLQRVCPTARVRVAPLSLGSGQVRGQASRQASSQPPIVGALDSSRHALIQRAAGRARDAGASFELIAGSVESVLENADILIAVSWPPADEQTLALAGMAAGRAVIVLETEGTGGWPALDPQTWQPRGWMGQPPIVVSIDPRDEEHSLSLALRRLSADASLRDALGSAAQTWWREHATLDHAIDAWRSILAEAVAVAPPPRPANWPRHLTADGTDRARDLVAQFGCTVDFLSS